MLRMGSKLFIVSFQYRNKLNEQQNGRLSAQRAALGARQEEMRSIDRRVSELQARLLRKRALNRQLAAAHRQPQQQQQQQQRLVYEYTTLVRVKVSHFASHLCHCECNLNI